MEDLEREVPHGEDDDDGDQACKNENDDLLEPFVEREEHPLRARSPESVLPLHRRTLPRKPDNERLTRGQIPMDKRNDHGAFTHRRRQALDRRMAHVAGSVPPRPRSGPVTRYPSSSRTMPTSAAHCVLGTPPRQRKSEVASTIRSS